MGESYTDYHLVPWHRRSRNLIIMFVAGFYCCVPLLWVACIICLTGDVYNNKVKKDGTLSRWSTANKVAALIILLIQIGVIAFVIATSK